MADIEFALQKGDISNNGQITIVDEDRLCYLVRSESKGAVGLRTISKALLKEFVEYFRSHPGRSSIDARNALSGGSDIDRFEYGYNSTLTVMANMVLNNERKGVQVPITPLKSGLQIIYYGAPGTGKSFEIEKRTKGQKVIRTTFHPDTDYSTFVGTYKPTMSKKTVNPLQDITTKELALKLKEYYNDPTIGKIEGIQKFCHEFWSYIVEKGISANQLASDSGISQNYAVEISKYVNFCKLLPKETADKKIIYKFIPQAFIQAYVNAWRDLNKPIFLIIEEINRGNCAQIFGDIFQLLDRKDDGSSSYEINPNEDVMLYLNEEFADNGIDANAPNKIKTGEVMSLPPNLHIWATMNTSDQSLFPIDSAFKRRWDWKYIPINTQKENWAIETKEGNYSWGSFLNKINFEIGDTTSSEDKKLGFYFCKAEKSIIKPEKFVSKVLFYVYNDVFKDYGFESKDFFKKNGKVMSFQEYYNIDGTINEDNVIQFLKNLKVDLAQDIEEQEDDLDEDGIGGNSGHKKLSSVILDDGEVFDRSFMTRFQIYLETLKAIGLDKVEPVLSASKYKRLGCPLISKQQYDAINNSSKYRYIKEGEYYIVKGMSDDTKIAALKYLNEQLNLGLTINYN